MINDISMETNNIFTASPEELEKMSIEAQKSNISERKLKVNTLLAERPEEWLEQCLDIYKEAIGNASGEIADEELAELVVRIGDIAYEHCGQQEYEDAEYAYDGAITICRTLAERNPDAYLPILAQCLGEQANVHCDMECYEMAELEYEEAITIYRSLAEKNPNAYLSRLSRVIGNLASLHEERQKYELAEAEYNEAITICRNLSEYNTDDNLLCLARNVGSLGGLHYILREYEQAEDELNEADALFRDLAEKHPECFLPDVAVGIKNRALLYEALGRYPEAQSGFQEYVTIYKKLAETNGIYNVEVATGLCVLAHSYFRQEKFEQVIPTIDEAISYDSNNPHLYDSKGLFMLELGRIDEALDLYDCVWELDHDFFIHYTSDLYDRLKEQGLI